MKIDGCMGVTADDDDDDDGEATAFPPKGQKDDMLGCSCCVSLLCKEGKGHNGGVNTDIVGLAAVGVSGSGGGFDDVCIVIAADIPSEVIDATSSNGTATDELSSGTSTFGGLNC